MKSWKTPWAALSMTASRRLQWSHDYEVVENSVLMGRASRRVLLQWSHDYEVVENVLNMNTNSTLVVLQWSHDYEVVENDS